MHLLKIVQGDTLGIGRIILLPAGECIVFPVGCMGQPTGLPHIYLWRRLCGSSPEELLFG